ncbi:HD domain-containing phosphohydrolase [Sporolactobacillus sp. Y61]|uniref:HD domain-containing phosphohydrolase n=1 Tax=Sporolactobacillus sp. Y61 TaxID=3160863 RepID=A0AAU8IBP2_9BACL
MPKAVTLDQLTGECLLAKDIYINSVVLYRAGTCITSEVAADLERKRIHEISVMDQPVPVYGGRSHQQLSAHQKRALTDRFQNDMAQIANELRYGRILHSESSYQWLLTMYVHEFAEPAVRLLMDSLKQWDPATYIHSIDVFVLCSLYSRHCSGLPSKDFILGSLLHDIGKLYTPKSILLKKGKLTEREYAKVKEHTVKGYQLLKRLGFPRETLRIVRSHHERLTGSGYPDHLDLTAQDKDLNLIAMTDVYSALTMKRSYRKPMSAIMALQIILSDSVNRRLFDLQDCYRLINFLHIFPPATQVRLTNGEAGTVLPNPNGSDILPKIKLDRNQKVIQLPRDLSITVKKVIGWDSSVTDSLLRQNWENYLKNLIEGDPLKAAECFESLSDGMRIEDIFTRLLERGEKEIRSDVARKRLRPSDALVASATTQTLLDWNMRKIAGDLKTHMGKVIVANLGSSEIWGQMKMVDNLLAINGWKTYLLAGNADASIIFDLIERKKARYLALGLTEQTQEYMLKRILNRLRRDYPDLILFIHGKGTVKADLPRGSILRSRDLAEFITNMRSCFPEARTARQSPR